MSSKKDSNIRFSHTIACIWDFDKTLIPSYMQEPIFDEYGIDISFFWNELSLLADFYKQRGDNVTLETIYMNHLLSFVKYGHMKGLSNAKLRQLGNRIKFCNGVVVLFKHLKKIVNDYSKKNRIDIKLEHYIISTGLAEMIRGSKISKYVEDIFGCEYIEEPLPPYFSQNPEFDLGELSTQISQIGNVVDNTTKTRFIFEINKGTNKNADIDVNSMISNENRRIPIANMIYIADGPSDIPVFSVVKKGGGKTFAVHNENCLQEFEQNDMLLSTGRIDCYGPSDYSLDKSTAKWLSMHTLKICERIQKENNDTLSQKLGKAPKHIHANKKVDIANISSDELKNKELDLGLQ